MPEIKIWSDTRGKGRCRSCQAPLEWAENVNTGHKIPFNDPIVSVRSYHDEDTHRLIEVVNLSVTTSHFSDCPDAAAFRKKTGKGAI